LPSAFAGLVHLQSIIGCKEYFFASVQVHSGLKYVQAHPWMLYDDARSLRGLSIPWLVMIVIGLPLDFIVFAWHVRHKSSSPVVTLYVGSLFQRYRQSVFWWEIVNVVKKLTIALLIRGISASNLLQVALITLAICVPLAIQASVRPWRRYWENVADLVGSVLLVSSLGASTRSLPVFYMVLSLDAIYVVTLLSMILWHLVTSKTEYQHIWGSLLANPKISPKMASVRKVSLFRSLDLKDQWVVTLNLCEMDDDEAISKMWRFLLIIAEERLL
jgi:hypothetical protein